MSQTKHNRALIAWSWVAVIFYSAGMTICLALWGMNRISDRQMLGITLALSWLALIEARIGTLITAYTKRDVDA